MIQATRHLRRLFTLQTALATKTNVTGGREFMKRILCYGDSNTWGYIAGSGKRYPHDVRWTGVVQRELGEGYQVLEEGLVGRTTVFDNPFAPWRNGIDYLMPCLITHKPIDLIIVMLGSNDLR